MNSKIFISALKENKFPKNYVNSSQSSRTRSKMQISDWKLITSKLSGCCIVSNQHRVGFIHKMVNDNTQVRFQNRKKMEEDNHFLLFFKGYLFKANKILNFKLR